MLQYPVSCQREHLRRAEEVRIEKQRGALFKGEVTRPQRSVVNVSRNVPGGNGIASSSVFILKRLLKSNCLVSFSHGINRARYKRYIACFFARK
jgi:hypothetical protein